MAPIVNPIITPIGPASLIQLTGCTKAPQPIAEPRAIAHTQCGFKDFSKVVLFFTRFFLLGLFSFFVILLSLFLFRYLCLVLSFYVDNYNSYFTSCPHLKHLFFYIPNFIKK